ncbi:alcohol dehydrogenase catalytic domain-containing protein [Rhodococcoides fascians A21d2]|uniref:zinc-dependent alcohol dehydrogenase n=1 Tax=Rhodococcoides fascians TaxID=1828 RepID=UPI0006902E4F|nr:alcohol dehydrogenase catalytic domain-containing protein [Rhodococcus fascians]QII00272.1 alcohol dehydrogenase catalytic domain-containing protein [Rhodococcus fascians A21d2]
MSTTLAQVLTVPGSFELREFALPQTSNLGGTLDVLSCGLCGSDVASFGGQKDHGGSVILGHEVIGRIGEIGEDTARSWGVKVGDRIAIEEGIPCMTCEFCRRGQHRVCTRSGVRYGDTTIDVAPSLWGGFARQMYLHPSTQIHRVPDSVPDNVATLFIPLSNGLAWTRDSGRLRPGQRVVVIGAGQHGIASALAALRGGAHALVVGTHFDRNRLDLAASYGCTTLAVDPNQSPTDAIVETLGGRADLVIDMTPGATMPLVTSVEVADTGGCVLWGGLKRGSGRAAVPVDDIIRKELRIQGLWARPSWAIAAAFDWMREVPDLARLCEKSYGLFELETAFRAATDADASKRPLHVAIVNSESEQS